MRESGHNIAVADPIEIGAALICQAIRAKLSPPAWLALHMLRGATMDVQQQLYDEIRTTHKRRLHLLEQRAAVMGINTPPEVTMEIEDLKALLGQPLPTERQAVIVARRLFSALRDLDNAIHDRLKDLLLFRADWPPERRIKVIDEINAFANRELIIDDVRAALRHLQLYLQTARGADVPLLEKLFYFGSGFLLGLGQGATPFPNYDTLRSFLLQVETASSEEAAAEVVRRTTMTLNVLNRERLAQMRDVLSQLEYAQQGDV
jgi:hypothetical protein